ncbi:MAG: NAD(P)/FAD-dependent oxidoreductase [Bacteroidia bacterium]|nr:NAD(P)/FAD-dependent oxidoreductase [Bacteroidia bacterium]
MKNLYNSSLANKKYDAIVIGSGMGGLGTAVFLAKSGKSVLVLERHYVAGGFTHTFKRKKFEWDVGVHYVGQVNRDNDLLRQAFDYLTDSKLQWEDMGEVYDQAIIEGDVYNFKKGRENQIQQMIAYFPEEKDAIIKYYKLVEKVANLSFMFFAERSMPHWLSVSVGYFLRKGFYKYSKQTTFDIISSLTTNKKLIAVLSAQCGNYGLPPQKSSFAIHAMVTDHFIEGGNYPVGGAASIPKAMVNVIEANGGTIAIKAEVKTILIEKNKAIGIEMMNGDKIYASKIVSNVGVHNTYKKLIQKNTDFEVSELNEIAPSSSHVCLYVGLNESDEQLNLPRHNIWLYNSYEFDKDYAFHLANKETIGSLAYISFPSAKDPQWKINNAGTSTIQVIAPCPYEWVQQWEDSKWQKRTDEYEVFKERIKNELLQKMYDTLPQTKGKVVIAELSTPLSTKHFSGYQKGEIYGMEHNTKRFSLKTLRATTPYKNLYLTGQDVICVGVGSALFSSIITSVSMLNRNVLWRIKMYTKKSKKTVS